MDIKIPLASKDQIAELLIKKGFEDESEGFSRRHFGGNKDSAIITVKGNITAEFIIALREAGKELSLKGVQSQCTQMLSMVMDPENKTITSLKALKEGLIAYFKRDLIDGWLYQLCKDGSRVPYLVTDVRYHAADISREIPEAISVHLFACTPKSNNSRQDPSIKLHREDVTKKTIPKVLAQSGHFKETKEFKDEYEISVDRYMKFQPKFGEQFTSKGLATSLENNYSRKTVQLGSGKYAAKLVNDEETLRREFISYRQSYFWQENGVKDTEFEAVPFHPYLLMFDLAEHEQFWVHSVVLSEYKYNKTLKDKLVLPQEHRDLIDILLDDMDVVSDDFIEGKSGGSTVLCMGGAGLGKTLTAEIYSELAGRPLYRVHSGQLGTSPDQVEKKLTEILQRTERWRAILLVDESDVYIRERDNSMEHNAIVAAFLRRLEYFSGLLFLTTNRSDDVDDAIKSRCIAMIRYEVPSAVDAKLIWSKLATQFNVSLQKPLINSLVKKYPKASGRDIKELLKLAAKYHRQKNRTIDMELFRQCAMFRGIDTGNSE